MPQALLWEPLALALEVWICGAGWETFLQGHPGRRASLLGLVPQISKQTPSLSPRYLPLLCSLCCSDWVSSPGSSQMAGPFLPAQDGGPEASSPSSPGTALGLPGNVALGIKGGNLREGRKWGEAGRKGGNKSVTAPSQGCDVMLLGFYL